MAPRRRPTYQGRRDRQKLRKVEDSNEATGTTASQRSKVPKRKYALIFGYKGTAYNGLQKQPDEGVNVRTVEGVLQDAMREIDAISDVQLADPFRLHWARVGRTDRGVHAACQVICAKLSMGPLTEEDKLYIEKSKARDSSAPPQDTVQGETLVKEESDGTVKATEDNKEELSPQTTDPRGENEQSVQNKAPAAGTTSEGQSEEPAEVVEESQPGELQRVRELRFLSNLRAKLPDDIEVFDVIRVWGTWDARMRAGRRVYEYCLPVEALQKVQLRDNHAAFVRFCQILNVEDSESKFCPFELKEKLFSAVKSMKDLSVVKQMKTDFSEEGLAAICEKWRIELSTIRKNYFMADAAQRRNLWEQFNCAIPEDADKPPYPPPPLSAFYNIPYVTEEQAKPFTNENLAELQEILNMLTGSHHWFNFTSKISAHDNSGHRYVETVKAYRMGKSIDGQEMIIIRVIGQSFLLNQIRKMLAMAIEIYMGMAPWKAIEDLLTPPLEPKRHVHLAPGEGLLLERVFFDLHDKQNRISADKLVLHHPFELEHPHGEIMCKFLETGMYPNIQDDPLTVRGVFRKDTATNLLLEDENVEMPSLTLSLEGGSDLPNWAKILRFKHAQLHPWIVNLFKKTQTWRRYLSDVLWHPYFLENHPTPLLRSSAPLETGADREDDGQEGAE